jgi:hypothetical protein
MHRYVVKVRTPSGNDTLIREVEAIARSGIDASIMVLRALSIKQQHFSVVVRHMGDA